MGNVVPFVKKTKNRGIMFPPAPKVGRRRQSKIVFFDRQEFSSLLGFYSSQVAKGLWRDYAVDFLPGQALFSAYRHAHESPVLIISKQFQANGKGREYALFTRSRRLVRADDLSGLTTHILAMAKQV